MNAPLSGSPGPFLAKLPPQPTPSGPFPNRQGQATLPSNLAFSFNGFIVLSTANLYFPGYSLGRRVDREERSLKSAIMPNAFAGCGYDITGDVEGGLLG